MLSEGDIQKIRELIQEEFKEALFREITIRRVARVPGEVDGKIDTSTQNLLDQLVMDLPVWVQSLGLMEGEVTKNTDAVNGVLTLMGSLQESFMTMARFVVALQEMGVMDIIEKELKPIEITDETNTG
ncbi:MAG: hypothetical protein ACXABY_34650 [Candidatus Thorarchaeota archaeon]|jgi:hypothetical protein